MRNVLILATGLRLQYRTLRCAAAVCDKVYVFGSAEARPLARSASCAGFFLLDGDSGFGPEHQWQIERIAAEHDIGWILPSDPHTTRFLTVMKDRLSTPCFPVPSTEIFDILDDKHRFAGLCQTLQVPHPLTELVASRAELLDRLESGAFPCPAVVKPLSMWGSRGVRRIDHDDRARVASEIDYEPILLQSYIAGRDVCAFFFCRKGRIQASATYMKGPNGIEFFSDERIAAQAAKIVDETRFDGVLGFDVRVSGDGSLAFIECNPRFWHNMDVAMRAGLNFVALGLDAPELSGRQPAPDRILIRSPSSSFRRIATPWKLRPADIETIRYCSSDPIAVASMFFQRFSRAGRAASGQSL